MPFRLAAVSFLFALAPVTSFARVVWVLQNPNAGFVLVWKDKASQNTGLDIIQSGAFHSQPQLLAGLLSCIVNNGATAVIIDAGILTHDIMVTSGKNAGCKGNIPAEHIHSTE